MKGNTAGRSARSAPRVSPVSRRRASAYEEPQESYCGHIGRDLLALLLFTAGLFIFIAACWPGFSRPAGPAVNESMQLMLGAGMYFLPLLPWVCAGLILRTSAERLLLRLLGASFALVVLASLVGGCFTARTWGGLLGSSAASFGYEHLGGFYPVLIALAALMALILIAGRALLVPFLRSSRDVVVVGAQAAGSAASSAASAVSTVASATTGLASQVAAGIAARTAADEEELEEEERAIQRGPRVSAVEAAPRKGRRSRRGAENDAAARRRAEVLAAEIEAFDNDDDSALLASAALEAQEAIEQPLPRRRRRKAADAVLEVPAEEGEDSADFAAALSAAVVRRSADPDRAAAVMDSAPAVSRASAIQDVKAGAETLENAEYTQSRTEASAGVQGSRPERPEASALPDSALSASSAQDRTLPASSPQSANPFGSYLHTKPRAEDTPEGQLGLFGSTQAGYELPPMTLLHNAPKSRGEEAFLEERARIIERTLASFNVEAKCVNTVVGPRVTRYELKIGPGINVNKIHGLADNLALELAVKAVRIEAPIPGLSAVGIEVPNASPQLVTLRSILESQVCQRSNHPLTVGLGRDIAGQAVVANLAKMPHLLVAGSTGSGKSVCLNALIVSLLMRNAPDTLRMILIDPKRVEMTGYADVPHLACPVVSDVNQAQSALKWVVAEMDRRYRLLQMYKARNIATFNQMSQDWDEASEMSRPTPLPYIVVIVDELADLMMLAGQAVEKLICRIAQLSRAVGIHLVIATQRPDVKVITGTIKANIPSRIAFAVVSQIDSRTIMDGGGAEKLLGSGDMLFQPIGESASLRVQGCFLADDEIDSVVEWCKGQATARYDESITGFGREGAEEAEDEFAGANWVDASSVGGRTVGRQNDEYFEEALEIVRETNRASTSYLQRRLKIGYNRAARVMEELERAGFVSAPDARGDRKVL
ncbi:DNA translocase FtsK [bacterium]|nr:DNA translocase FtsK [bacterium]